MIAVVEFAEFNEFVDIAEFALFAGFCLFDIEIMNIIIVPSLASAHPPCLLCCREGCRTCWQTINAAGLPELPARDCEHALANAEILLKKVP